MKIPAIWLVHAGYQCAATTGATDELLADYPYLEREDVLAALEYAAAAAQERELAVAAPAA
jgi:hypothetical protein